MSDGSPAQGASTPSAQFWEQQWLYWDRLGPPLRPCAEDVALYERLVGDAVAACRESPRALLLGVTPELARMGWPARARVLAVDRSQGMIDHVWPRDAWAGAEVVRGEWTELPLSDGACEAIVGDGCFSQLSHPAGYSELARELARVLRPGGRFVMRAFVRPDAVETLPALFAELEARKIHNFHAFKWRLNMALQSDIALGVRLADVYDAFMSRLGEPRKHSEWMGWPLETVSTIEAYRASNARYTYPTLEELERALEPYFTLEARLYSGYELGERCPVLSFRRR